MSSSYSSMNLLTENDITFIPSGTNSFSTNLANISLAMLDLPSFYLD